MRTDRLTHLSSKIWCSFRNGAVLLLTSRHDPIHSFSSLSLPHPYPLANREIDSPQGRKFVCLFYREERKELSDGSSGTRRGNEAVCAQV